MINKQDDLRLGTLFSNCNKKVKIGLIGYPIDLGVIRNGGRQGASGGPEIVRDLIHKKGCISNSEYGISLEDIEMKDFGDTNLFEDELKTAHLKHQNIINKVLNDGFIAISIGGGNDQSFPNFLGFSKYHENHFEQVENTHMLVINIDAHLDVRPLLKGNEPHSGSPFRQMLDTNINYTLDFIEFASQGSQCSTEHVEYVQKKGGKIIWLKDLHGSLLENSTMKRTTVETFVEIINNKKYDNVFISFDLDSIQSSDCPGVSCPSSIGLTSEEALSICYQAGLCNNVRMFDISEFNPIIESYRTGTLIVNMIYYFLIGVANRNL